MNGLEGLGNFIFLALLIGVFYFLLIRPQRKRVDEHRKLVDSIGIGDEIVTIGGLYGKVSAIGDDYMELETAPGVRLRYTKTAVHHRVSEKLEPGGRSKALPATEEVEEKATESAPAAGGKSTAARKPAAARSARTKTTAAKSTAKRTTKTTARSTSGAKKTTRGSR